ncbi:hypothetical protein CAPTEDRAFT_109432 [Capitella teleta]|uniref:Protein kinase domain-containing protein n=1 Tax=Capitella teleta TaxID=283909 RepID=R7UWG6_CAPTE|nr:hypothetical protein CAPTEDRAFT_109432 [Capitella teleta]|eukprot:ELU10963.1 hypothetical protein CAPTEDRAFT_109432 [Capitella teleta]
MDLVNKLKSAVSNVLPVGNPITNDHEIHAHRASAGPGLMWKVYSGHKKTTKQEVSIFIFEKKQLDRYSKYEKEKILESFKRGVSQLTRLRHPKILSILHPLEESRESLAFAAEPVFASLANVLHQHDNMPSPIPPVIQSFKLYDVEIKYGLLQVTEGLAFIHNSVKMIHGGISPESIMINGRGTWKLFGFDFCIANSNPADQAPYFTFREWRANAPVLSQPKLDYLAPEYALTQSCDTSSDMYSLGVLLYAIFNNGKPIFQCQDQWGAFEKNISELKRLKISVLGSIPEEIREHVKMLLNTEPTVRPDADQISKIPFFEDVGSMTLQYLDTLMQRDNLEKSQFFKGLPQVVSKLPKRVCLQRLLPSLVSESSNTNMVPFILPNILQIAESTTEQEYAKHILPSLIPIFKITNPIQVTLIFLQNMNLLLSKTPQADIRNHVLPMVYSSLECGIPQIQELCLTIIPTFASLIEYSSMKNALIPRIRKLCLQTSTLAIRVNCLVCIGKLLEYMDKWYVLDEIFPILQEIPSREPAILMSILGIYKVTMSHKKLGITKDIMANKVLPFIFPLCIDNNINLQQFNAFIGMVKEMIGQVESEHRGKLEQLDTMQKEQRWVPQSAYFIPNLSCISSAFRTLQQYACEATPGGPVTNGPSKDENSMVIVSLTMEEKQRLAQQKEQQERFKQQTPLATSLSASPAPISTKSNQPKDLTSSLMSSDFMNTANSRPSNFSARGGSSMGNSALGNSSMGNSSMGMNSSMSMTSPMGLSSSNMGGNSMMGSGMSTGSAFGSSSMGSMSGGFGGNSSFGAQSPPQPKKPVDMSSFDSLLPNNKPRMSMNQMQHQPRPASNLQSPMGMMAQQPRLMGAPMMGGSFSPMGQPMGMQQQQPQSSAAKLSSHELDEFLK